MLPKAIIYNKSQKPWTATSIRLFLSHKSSLHPNLRRVRAMEIMDLSNSGIFIIMEWG